MSTNIERAAEVIGRESTRVGSRHIDVAEALAAEGLLVTDELVCETCEGRGWDIVRPLDDDDDVAKCPDCKGSGRRNTLTDEQRRLIRLGKAFERVRADFDRLDPALKSWSAQQILHSVLIVAERVDP